MSKKETRHQIAEFVKANPEKLLKLPSGNNLDFDSYMHREAYRNQLNRSGGGQVKKGRSPFFVRGGGNI